MAKPLFSVFICGGGKKVTDASRLDTFECVNKLHHQYSSTVQSRCNVLLASRVRGLARVFKHEYSHLWTHSLDSFQVSTRNASCMSTCTRALACEQLYSSVTRLTDLSNLFYFQYDLVDAPKHLYKVIITNLCLLSMD